MLFATGKYHPGSSYTARGFSLIELMVSVLLGLVLTTGIVNVYLESKRNYVAEEDMARIQENGRFALNYLKRELMQAGFFAGKLNVGQMAPGSVTTDCVASGDWALDASEPLDLINDFSGSLETTNVTTFSSTCLAVSEIEQDTDIFSVKRTAGEPTLKDGVYKTGVTAAKPTQWYLKVENYGDAQSWWYNNTSGFASGDTFAGSRVDYWEFYSQIFFIRNYSVATSDGIPTLCVARLDGNAVSTQCLVEGVENMQLEFGIDNDADGIPNQFLADPNPADMANAVVARVYLLLRGINTISGYTNTKTYNLGQKAVTKNDAYLRRVMTLTVQMRNATIPTI